MTDEVKLIDRDSGKVVWGRRYVEGRHPPCKGVRVTMGKNGVLARASTVHGPHSVLYNGDWLLRGVVPEGDEIYTDKYVRDFFYRADEEPEEVGPVVLG